MLRAKGRRRATSVFINFQLIFVVAPSIVWYGTHEEQSIVNGLHLAPSIEWYATL